MVWAGGTESQHVDPCPSQPYWVEPMSFPFKHSEGPQEQAEKPTMFESKQQFFIFSFQDVACVFAAFYAGFLLLKCSLLEYSIVAESPALLRSGDRAGGGGGWTSGATFSRSPVEWEASVYRGPVRSPPFLSRIILLSAPQSQAKKRQQLAYL